MAHRDGSKSGGRRAGTQNKSTRELKAFLDRVFEPLLLDPAFEARLRRLIRSFKLSDKVLLRLLEYWAGAPPRNVTLDPGPSLASLIAGTAHDDVDEDTE